MSKSSRADERTLGAWRHVDKREFIFPPAGFAQMTHGHCHGIVTIPLRDRLAAASMCPRSGAAAGFN